MTNPFESIDARLSNIEILLLDLTQCQKEIPAIPPASESIRLYGDKAAAAYLGCSVVTVQNLRRAGAIPFYRTGRKLYYVTSELDSSLRVERRKFRSNQ